MRFRGYIECLKLTRRANALHILAGSGDAAPYSTNNYDWCNV